MVRIEYATQVDTLDKDGGGRHGWQRQLFDRLPTGHGWRLLPAELHNGRSRHRQERVGLVLVVGASALRSSAPMRPSIFCEVVTAATPVAEHGREREMSAQQVDRTETAGHAAFDRSGGGAGRVTAGTGEGDAGDTADPDR
ncbi:hypothetical protein [Nocardia sp. NPDC047654]|uniref:hypothetical protein n=1 Tax=Nocardia sp. NPDC047654 TaxID=3364314 RepID=UPI00371E1D78